MSVVKPEQRAKLAEERLTAALLQNAARETELTKRHDAIMAKEKQHQKKLCAELQQLEQKVQQQAKLLKETGVQTAELQALREQVALHKQMEESRRLQEELRAQSQVTTIVIPAAPTNALKLDKRPYAFTLLANGWSFVPANGLQQYRRKYEVLEAWNSQYEFCRVLYTHTEALRHLEQLFAEGSVHMVELYCVMERGKPDSVLTVHKSLDVPRALQIRFSGKLGGISIDGLTYDKLRTRCMEHLNVEGSLDDVLQSNLRAQLCEFRV
jgi:hypothetical protein